MTRTFDVSEGFYLPERYQHRFICPDCRNHKQSDEPCEVLDCKNCFKRDGM